MLRAELTLAAKSESFPSAVDIFPRVLSPSEGDPLISEIAPVTKAVVAICFVLVPFAAVGASGVPVSSGLSSNA